MLEFTCLSLPRQTQSAQPHTWPVDKRKASYSPDAVVKEKKPFWESRTTKRLFD